MISRTTFDLHTFYELFVDMGIVSLGKMESVCN